jgi:hypothetical protein
MRRVIPICATWLLFTSAVAVAQETFDEKYGKMISDGAAREAIGLALSKIHLAACKPNKPCAPASASEKASPPITIVDGRAAMVFGIKSALAQWCGLDWKRGFLPMIAFGKGPMKMTDRQLNLMSLIHGDFMARQLATYKNGGECPPAVRQQLDTQLPKT